MTQAPSPLVALQLYSLRDHLVDLDSTFARVAALGVEHVEPFMIFDRPAEVAPALHRHGLSMPTGHSPFLSDELEFQGRTVPIPPMAATFQAATMLGVNVLIDPMVPPERWRDAAAISRTADRLNAAVDPAADAGLRVGYHNHSFEFHHSVDGRTGYEYFVSLLDPRVVLEVDVYWAAVAGQDVPALLRRLGERVVALHLKDGAVAHDPFAQGQIGSVEHANQVPLGEGDLDVAAIMDAAPRDRFDVIEFDRIDGDVFAAIERSLRYVTDRNQGGAE